MFQRRTGPRPSRARAAALDTALAALASTPHVADVSDPFDPRGPTVSPDGRTAFATVSYDVDGSR